MNLRRLQRLATLAGRIGIALTIFSFIPQISAETQAESEAIAVVLREGAPTAETRVAVASHDRIAERSSLPRNSTGVSHLGREGRWISATLLAPMRC